MNHSAMKPLLFILIILLCAPYCIGLAQKRKPAPKFNNAKMANAQFLEKQWWLGLKAGTTLSGTQVIKSYSGLSPVNYEAPTKVYSNFTDLGFTASLEAAFSFRQFTIVLQPGYRSSRFAYTTEHLWTDYTNPDNRLELSYLQQQRAEYADIPLLFRYDITATRLRPYVQAGAYYSVLIQAIKSVQMKGTDYASGGENRFSGPAISVGATELFAPRHWGLIGGLGASYHTGNVRFTLEVQYRKGMSLANDTDNRYANERLSSIGDVMDDMQVNTMLITFGTLFPLKFLSKSFQSINPR